MAAPRDVVLDRRARTMTRRRAFPLAFLRDVRSLDDFGAVRVSCTHAGHLPLELVTAGGERVDQDRAAPMEPPNLPFRPAQGRAGSRQSRRTVGTERVQVADRDDRADAMETAEVVAGFLGLELRDEVPESYPFVTPRAKALMKELTEKAEEAQRGPEGMSGRRERRGRGGGPGSPGEPGRGP